MKDKTRDQLIAENGELRRRVTAMESVEAELRRSEAKWRSVVANTPVFVCVVDRAGAIQYLNRTVPGIAMEDAIGRSTYDFLDPAHWEIARECIERVFDTGQTAFYESVSAGPNGSRSWYETNVGPVTVGDQVVAVTLIATDITQRKHAETALLESEERFKAFMDNSPALAWMKDDQGRHVYINKPHEKRFGLRLEDRKGKTDFELWPPETAEQFWKNDQAVLAGDSVMEVVEEIAAPDEGHTYWWNFKFPFQDASGKRYVGGVGIDITERKRAEEALQKAHDELERRVEERTAELAEANENLTMFRKFVEASGEGFGMADLDGRIAYANPVLCRLMGEEELGDVIGKNISAYYPEEHMQRRRNEMIPALLREEEWHTETSVLRRHGKPISIQQTSSLIRDEAGNPLRTAVVISDITERKQAEEALRASKERYELAVRGAGVGIWDYDIRTGKVYYSPRWRMMFGFEENEIGDSLEDWVRLLHPDERDWILKFQEDFLAGTLPTVTVEYRIRHKDGSYRWIVAHGLAVRDEQGKAYRLVGSHGDITDRKRAEEALAREHRTLKHLLQSSDHERRVIAYEIHDGLAQELAAAIMQFATFDHLKEIKPKQAAAAYHAAMTILRQGHFEVRRLISGVRPPILDEEGIVAAISHLVNEEKREKGNKIEYLSKVEFERLTPILENAIYRIVQEALTNACRHSKADKVHVELVQCGDQIRIEVRDRGVGFKPEDVGDSHFGLEGIRERARLLGGKATIETRLGRGTMVVVELPIVLRRPEDEQPEESAE